MKEDEQVNDKIKFFKKGHKILDVEIKSLTDGPWEKHETSL